MVKLLQLLPNENKKFKIVKKRNIKKSNRGFYIHDKELLDTYFKTGTHIKYSIDTDTKKLTIIPTDEKTRNTVSKKKYKETEKPIIDLRNKDILNTFSDCDYLELTILEDTITIEGYKNVLEESNLISKVTNKIKNCLNINSCKKIKSKKINQLVLSKKQFIDAVGFENLTLDDTEYINTISLQNNSFTKDLKVKKQIQQNIENDKIALEVLSVFSGSGMLDKGFKDNGFKFIHAIEMNASACESYKYNIGDIVDCVDVTKIDLSKLPKMPIVIGGIPCKKFSLANRVDNINMLENPKHILVEKFIELIELNNRCKIFIIEEVPQILTACKGKFFNEIKKRLSNFKISCGILNSSNFGNAQNRKRAIIVGSKIGKIDLPSGNPHEITTVRQSFKGLNDSIPNQLDFTKPSEKYLERIKYVPQGGNYLNVPESIRSKGRYSNLYRRLSYDELSITICHPRKSKITHPEENRIISVRECARLQGMPDDFIYKGGLDSKQQQVCDGVPYQLSTAIAKVVKKAIELFNNKLQPLLTY
ncbi:MAG TPA: DNA cytosine methyltransferase [Candidatus Paceibacterota bacterium]